MNTKIKIGSGKELLKEAMRVQEEFLALNTYWNLEECIQEVCKHFDVNKNAINSAMIVAKALGRD
jgi:hypothetical protein